MNEAPDLEAGTYVGCSECDTDYVVGRAKPWDLRTSVLLYDKPEHVPELDEE
jgi:hypothetical protein